MQSGKYFFLTFILNLISLEFLCQHNSILIYFGITVTWLWCMFLAVLSCYYGLTVPWLLEDFGMTVVRLVMVVGFWYDCGMAGTSMVWLWCDCCRLWYNCDKSMVGLWCETAVDFGMTVVWPWLLCDHYRLWCNCGMYQDDLTVIDRYDSGTSVAGWWSDCYTVVLGRAVLLPSQTVLDFGIIFNFSISRRRRLHKIHSTTRVYWWLWKG